MSLHRIKKRKCLQAAFQIRASPFQSFFFYVSTLNWECSNVLLSLHHLKKKKTQNKSSLLVLVSTKRTHTCRKSAGLRGFIILIDKAEWQWGRFIIVSARLVLFLSSLARSDISALVRREQWIRALLYPPLPSGSLVQVSSIVTEKG